MDLNVIIQPREYAQPVELSTRKLPLSLPHSSTVGFSDILASIHLCKKNRGEMFRSLV